MNIFPTAQKQFFEVKNTYGKFCDSDPNAGSGIFWTLDPGWKNPDTGSGINIPDPQHCTCVFLCKKKP
jgi:hypothetical protein